MRREGATGVSPRTGGMNLHCTVLYIWFLYILYIVFYDYSMIYFGIG